MKQYRKVTKEMKEKIVSMRQSGSTLLEIGKELGISGSTAAYHSSADYKKKSIARTVKNQKPRDRSEYMKNYQSNRYKNDEEFRENMRTANRENQRRKHGKSNNLS